MMSVKREQRFEHIKITWPVMDVLSYSGLYVRKQRPLISLMIWWVQL